MVHQHIKKRAVHRASILLGQLQALKDAIEKEVYCTELLRQSYTIQQSLKSLDKMLLENHLKSHVGHQMRNHKEEGRAVKELIEVYTLSHK